MVLLNGLSKMIVEPEFIYDSYQGVQWSRFVSATAMLILTSVGCGQRRIHGSLSESW